MSKITYGTVNYDEFTDDHDAVCPWIRRSTSSYDDYRSYLFRYEDDRPVEYLGCDGGEPEDQTFNRDWSFVVSALNAAARRAEQSDTLAEMARLNKNFSLFIDDDPANIFRPQEAQDWGRLAKICEEAGEVITAFIGMTGQNPRKGVHKTLDDLLGELMDVAVTALGAYEHMTGHQGVALVALHQKLRFISQRAGLL